MVADYNDEHSAAATGASRGMAQQYSTELMPAAAALHFQCSTSCHSGCSTHNSSQQSLLYMPQ
jgi:hypothetical protein